MVTTDYELGLKNIVSEIKKIGAKTVLLQLPDGLKPEATRVCDSLKQTGAKIYIWAGSCFGACDMPNVKNVDLVIQFGHNKFRKF